MKKTGTILVAKLHEQRASFVTFSKQLSKEYQHSISNGNRKEKQNDGNKLTWDAFRETCLINTCGKNENSAQMLQQFLKKTGLNT